MISPLYAVATSAACGLSAVGGTARSRESVARSGVPRHADGASSTVGAAGGGSLELRASAASLVSVVRVIPLCLALRLNLLMGIIQCPDSHSSIWKCLDPGEACIWTPPGPRNQISPVLQRIRASFLRGDLMPIMPGIPDPCRHGERYSISTCSPELSWSPADMMTS